MSLRISKRYRSSVSILADILEAVREEERVGKTRIMQKANLPTDRLETRLSQLLQEGLIHEESEDDRKFYTLTEKGLEFLEQYGKARSFLKAFGIAL